MKRFHGNRVGSKARAVYVCKECGQWHDAEPKKQPGQCDCGNMEFTYFPSRSEAKRYGQLKLLLRGGEIVDLELQPKFPLYVTTPDGKLVKIGEYRADFGYRNKGSDTRIIDDVKGNADTHMSHWKRKHAEAQHGVVINLVRMD